MTDRSADPASDAESRRAAAFDVLLAMGQHGDFDSAAELHTAMKALRRERFSGEARFSAPPPEPPPAHPA